MSSSKLPECIICFCTLQSEPCKDPEYFTSVFDSFCRLLEIKLIEPMQWNFERDNIPFCQFCCTVVEKLKGLHDQLNLIQKEISGILQVTKHKIFTSGYASKISNELDEIDRVTFIRQQAIKGYQVVENSVNCDEVTAPHEDTDLLVKLEIEEENNEDNSSFLDRIKEESGFQEQIDEYDPFDGATNDDNHIETKCIIDNYLISGDVNNDSDLLFIQSETNEESVQISPSTSDTRISDPENRNKCRYCEKTFLQKSSLKLHLKRHLQKGQQECENCDEIFETTNSLENHRREIHKSEGAFKCAICCISFYSANDLQCHVVMHNRDKPFKCEVCGKCFSKSESLTRHKKIHSDENPYKCHACDKSFKHSHHLISHVRMHSGEKPFKCDACDKSFKHPHHLVSHKRRHTGERPYKCNTCDKSFTDNNHLISHKRIHTGEKPYKCNDCGKSFLQKSQLITHTRIHTGEKPFKCDACGKCFSLKQNLTIHVAIHTGEKPYKCDACERCFSHFRSLCRHRKTCQI